MRIQLLSDLHFEFHRDQGESFVDSLDPVGVDVLVLAGDIAVGHGIGPALARFAGRYPRVVYVPGNHEFYGGGPDVVAEEMRTAEAAHSNLSCLDCSEVSIGGVRFVGGTLWYRQPEPDDPVPPRTRRRGRGSAEVGHGQAYPIRTWCTGTPSAGARDSGPSAVRRVAACSLAAAT